MTKAKDLNTATYFQVLVILMAYKTRRDFLKYVLVAGGNAGGLGAIATDAFAQTQQQTSGNPSRRFLDALLTNLHKADVNSDGSYTIIVPGRAKESVEAKYVPRKGSQLESLTVTVKTYSETDESCRNCTYRFENVGLQDKPTRVIENDKHVNFQSIQEMLRDAYVVEYEKALGKLTNHLKFAPVKPKK